MQLMNTAKRWGVITRTLHWAIAGIIIFQLGLGAITALLVDDVLEQFRLIQIHKSWGFVVFVLALGRIAWRLANRTTPSLPDHMSFIEMWAAKLGHLGLYGLMIIMPVSGWLMASASPLQDRFGVKNKVFGLFEMYDPFVPGNDALATTFAMIHFYAAIGLSLLLVGHVGAALWHHFHHKDDVLNRMIGRR